MASEDFFNDPEGGVNGESQTHYTQFHKLGRPSLSPHSPQKTKLVSGTGLEPVVPAKAADFKSAVSPDSTTRTQNQNWYSEKDLNLYAEAAGFEAAVSAVPPPEYINKTCGIRRGT